MNDQSIMNGLMGKIYAIISSPDQASGKVIQADKPFVSFVKVGIPVSEADLNFASMSTMAEVNAHSAFSQLMNDIPRVSGLWKMSGHRIWDVYEKALTQIKLPNLELSAKEKEILKNIDKYLETEVENRDPFTGDVTKGIVPSRQVIAYNNCMGDYFARAKAYNALQIQAEEPGASPASVKEFNLNGPIARQEAIKALQAWEAEGNKGNVEEARSRKMILCGSGPATVYAQMKNDLTLARRESTLGNYYSTYFFPLNLFGPRITWTKFRATNENLHTYASKDQSAWGGGVEAKYGLFSVSGSVDHKSGDTSYQGDYSKFGLTVELIQVPLLRTWFNPGIFKNRNWKWRTGNEMISSGGDKDVASDLMPAYPTSFIMARNLRITMDTKNERNRKAISQLTTSASGGWGPFRVKGHYEQFSDKSNQDMKITDEGIESKGMQIIAFVCERVPKSPNPDSTIKFD